MYDTVVKLGCVYFGEYQFKHLEMQKSKGRKYEKFSTYFISSYNFYFEYVLQYVTW